MNKTWLKMMALLCSVMLVLAGCSKGEKEEPAEDLVLPEEALAPELEEEPNPYAHVEGKVVSLLEHMTDSSERFQLEGQVAAGTQEQLDQWYELIADTDFENMAGLYISNMEEEGYDLEPWQVENVVNILKELDLDLFEEAIGNPATGGSTMIVAVDWNGDALWKVSFDSQWFIVELDGASPVFDMAPAAQPLSDLRQDIVQQ